MSNLYEKLYKRGTINSEEYEKFSTKNRYIRTKRNGKKESLDKKLSDKLEREFEEFREKLMKKDKEKILDSAYELTVKEELKEELKNMALYDEEKEIMLIMDNLLNEFYYDWLDCDTPLGESLRDNLKDSIATLTRYIIKTDEKDVNKER